MGPRVFFLHSPLAPLPPLSQVVRPDFRLSASLKEDWLFCSRKMMVNCTVRVSI